jgi:hypothetical protein
VLFRIRTHLRDTVRNACLDRSGECIRP